MNTGKIIVAQVPVYGGRAAVEGTTYIAGLANPGARIDLDFLSPTGAVSGRYSESGRRDSWTSRRMAWVNNEF